MERSHVPLHKWLLATHLMAASKKGMSAKQSSRMLGVTYKTAWFLCHRIREAMDGANDTGPLGGPGKVVESDEAFVGGTKKRRLSGKVAPMKKVMTLVERDGRTFLDPEVPQHMRATLVANVHRSSTLMADDARVYWSIGRELAAHGATLDADREFARPGGVHSNTAENFFSILKRGVIGTYHHWSPIHMHRYLAEFDMRYSTKKMTDGERAGLSSKEWSVAALPIGGLVNSQPNFLALALIGQRRKRWTRMRGSAAAVPRSFMHRRCECRRLSHHAN